MSAIKVYVDCELGVDAWFVCRWCGEWGMSHPEMPNWSIAAAADAGRAHLASFHTAQMPPGYSRRCGTHTSRCGAPECVCDKSPSGDAGSSLRGLQRFADEVQPVLNGAIDNMNAAMNGVIQRTYDESRSDA